MPAPCLNPPHARGDPQLGMNNNLPSLNQFQQVYQQNIALQAENRDFRIQAENNVRELEHDEVSRVRSALEQQQHIFQRVANQQLFITFRQFSTIWFLQT